MPTIGKYIGFTRFLFKIYSALRKKWQLNEGTVYSSWKPPIFTQSDAQSLRIKRLTVLLFQKRAMNSFKEMFRLASMLPLAVMHRWFLK